MWGALRRRVAWLALTCAACTAGTAEHHDELTSPLLGSDVAAPASIVQRNAIITQKFPVAALTPDGRLGFAWPPIDIDQNLPDGWEMKLVALGDPSMNAIPALTASMTAQSYSLGVGQPDSDKWTPPPRDFDGGSLNPGTKLKPYKVSGASTLAMDPRFSATGKPLPVRQVADCVNMVPATRDSLSDPNGRYDCYRIIHLQPFVRANDSERPIIYPLYQALMTVVVDARRPDGKLGVVARSATPTIVFAQIGKYEMSQISEACGGCQDDHIDTLEMSATADGRLVVAQPGYFTFNETPWNPKTWETQQAYSNFGLRTANKRICRRLDPVTGEPNCADDSTKESFSRVYPVAAYPMYRGDGDPIIPRSLCGYTWITPEGTDIFCRPFVDSNGLTNAYGVENAPSIQTFAFGQHTNWIWQRIDGGINTRRFNPDMVACADPTAASCTDQTGRQRAFSPLFLNTSTGFWAQNRGSGWSALPVLRQWPLFQFMSLDNSLTTANSRDQLSALGLTPSAGDAGLNGNMHYWEASFACARSPNCLLHLPMNEVKYAGTTLVARAMTPDFSNNTDFLDDADDTKTKAVLSPQVGQLFCGAQFVGELYGADRDERYLSGFRGTGISLPSNGFVSIMQNSADIPCQRSKGCLIGEEYNDGFTAELAVLPLYDTSAANVTLAEHYGLWSLWLNNGVLTATIARHSKSTGAGYTTRLTYTTIPSSTKTATPAAQAANWTHIALRAAPREGEIQLFVNGQKVASTPSTTDDSFHASAVNGEMLRVGSPSDCSGWQSSVAKWFVDELRFHNAPLPFEEIAASAGSFAGRADYLSPAQAQALLSGYFSRHNQQQLPLDAAGFPRSIRPEDLRIPAAFAPYAQSTSTAFDQLVEIGRTLFNSPLLSIGPTNVPQNQAGTGRPMTCATCHVASKSFTDGRARALGVVNDPSAFNTPTIVNRLFSTNQFFARTSQDVMSQVLKPIENPKEMNSNVARILNRLNGPSPDAIAIAAAFRAADPSITMITRSSLQLALAAYELSQVSADSLGDWIIASGTSVTDPEGYVLSPALVRRGKVLFEGKARCSACHIGPNLSDELAHDTGIAPVKPRAFKTPTLWNIANTKPYFHDGTRTTLRQVLDFYNRGGDGPQRSSGGLRIIDPELRPLALGEAELMALEAYLRSLQNASRLPMN